MRVGETGPITASFTSYSLGRAVLLLQHIALTASLSMYASAYWHGGVFRVRRFALPRSFRQYLSFMCC